MPLCKSLQAEKVAEEAKEELEVEKSGFFQEMSKEAQRSQELEEALEAEQQTMIDEQEKATARAEEEDRIDLQKLLSLG